MARIKSHKELRVYQVAFETAMEIFKISKTFPKEERYSLTDQVRRSSRSVAANIAEAFRMRRYPLAFVSKLNQSEGESAESQVWLDFAEGCEYISPEIRKNLDEKYEYILGMLVNMINDSDSWKIK
ncbi:MAG TPA: four helix bundle protein [Bacteroidales bacterium]|nr:four helix bundle protein [Bacteroidales bacterium]